MLGMAESMQAVSERIVSLDRAVRFAGMADGSRKVASKYRESLVPLLTEKESELSVIQSTMRMMLRKPLEEKLGGWSTPLQDTATSKGLLYHCQISGRC